MVKWIVVMKIQPSICLDHWGKPRKNPSQVARHRDSNSGPTECESRALPRSHLARLKKQVLLGFTTLFTILGHQRRFRHRAWKVRQILLRGSNFGLRFFTCRKFTTRDTLFTILGHQRHFRHRAWKVRQILLRGSNFGLRFFYVP